MAERRVIAHVDMDAFYVSVELRRRPELRGLPVVVAGSGPRAVVTTASYEARRFGVFSATPAERARRLCPQAVFIPPDFDEYRARSREVMAVLHEHVERVEVVGLDEAYLDLTPLERPKAATRRIRAAVREATGLKVRLDDCSTHTRARTVAEPTNDEELVRRVASELLREFDPPRPVRLLGVRVAGLDETSRPAAPRAAGQLELAL